MKVQSNPVVERNFIHKMMLDGMMDEEDLHIYLLSLIQEGAIRQNT